MPQRVYFLVEGTVQGKSAWPTYFSQLHVTDFSQVLASGMSTYCTADETVLLIASIRYYTRKHATAYNITGWVRNTAEGKVSQRHAKANRRSHPDRDPRLKVKRKEMTERWRSS